MEDYGSVTLNSRVVCPKSSCACESGVVRYGPKGFQYRKCVLFT